MCTWHIGHWDQSQPILQMNTCRPMVNVLAKNAYFSPPPSSHDAYFFPVFAAPRVTNHESNLWKKCVQRGNFAIFTTYLANFIENWLKQYNLGKFSLFCMDNFWVRSLFLPHFSRTLISSPLGGGAVDQNIYRCCRQAITITFSKVKHSPDTRSVKVVGHLHSYTRNCASGSWKEKFGGTWPCAPLASGLVKRR